MFRQMAFVVEVMLLNPALAKLGVKVGALGLRFGWHRSKETAMYFVHKESLSPVINFIFDGCAILRRALASICLILSVETPKI